MQEKIEMLEYRKKRLEKEPILLNTVSSSEEDLSKLEFRKVLVEGAFDEKKSIYIGPRSRTISGVIENGYFVVTPLIPTSGDAGRRAVPLLPLLRRSAARGLATDLVAEPKIDQAFIEAWKKVAPNLDPPKTPLSFLKPRPPTPSSIPSKLTVNFVLPYKSQIANKEVASHLNL